MAHVTLVPIGNGADDREMIQDAIDSMEQRGGGVVQLTSGKYYIGPADGEEPIPAGAFSLKLGDNIHLMLDVDATLVRRYAGGDDINAVVRNRDIFNGNTNIRFTGGTITVENDENVGHQVAFTKTSFLSIDNVTHRGTSLAWNMRLEDCTDVTVSNLVMDSGTDLFEDGLHILGGQRIAIDNCVISCGDDAIALVNTPDDQETDLTDVAISNCSLHSRRANAIKVEIVAGAEQAIRRVTFSNIAAKVGTTSVPVGGGMFIYDASDEGGMISDINISDVILDVTENSGEGFTIYGVDRVTLQRVVVLQPYERCSINGSNEVHLVDCEVHNPRGGSQDCVRVAPTEDCTHFSVIGGQYVGAGRHGILLGETGAVTGFQVSNTNVRDASLVGILALNASGGLVTTNLISGCGSLGVQELSPSGNSHFAGNHWRDNADDFYGPEPTSTACCNHDIPVPPNP